MKNKPSAEEAAQTIRELLLALPAEDRRRVSGGLVSFLLAVSGPAKVPSASAPTGEKTALTPEQQDLIRDLGEQMRRLNNQMGDDLYFFM